jgi:hypothetical protein
VPATRPPESLARKISLDGRLTVITGPNPQRTMASAPTASRYVTVGGRALRRRRNPPRHTTDEVYVVLEGAIASLASEGSLAAGTDVARNHLVARRATVQGEAVTILCVRDEV